MTKLKIRNLLIFTLLSQVLTGLSLNIPENLLNGSAPSSGTLDSAYKETCEVLECPNRYTLVGTSCLTFDCSAKRDSKEAKRFCNEQNSQLASFQTKEELIIARAILKQLSSRGSSCPYWISTPTFNTGGSSWNDEAHRNTDMDYFQVVSMNHKTEGDPETQYLAPLCQRQPVVVKCHEENTIIRPNSLISLKKVEELKNPVVKFLVGHKEVASMKKKEFQKIISLGQKIPINRDIYHNFQQSRVKRSDVSSKGNLNEEEKKSGSQQDPSKAETQEGMSSENDSVDQESSLAPKIPRDETENDLLVKVTPQTSNAASDSDGAFQNSGNENPGVNERCGSNGFGNKGCENDRSGNKGPENNEPALASFSSTIQSSKEILKSDGSEDKPSDSLVTCTCEEAEVNINFDVNCGGEPRENSQPDFEAAMTKALAEVLPTLLSQVCSEAPYYRTYSPSLYPPNHGNLLELLNPLLETKRDTVRPQQPYGSYYSEKPAQIKPIKPVRAKPMHPLLKKYPKNQVDELLALLG